MSIQLQFFKGSKLWKLDGNRLQNKAFGHFSFPCFFGTNESDTWNFKTKDDLIYIENSSKTKVLEATSKGNVFLMDFEEDKAEQFWKKGAPNDEGYFTLENSKVPKVMTAIASLGEGTAERIQIKGSITKR